MMNCRDVNNCEDCLCKTCYIQRKPANDVSYCCQPEYRTHKIFCCESYVSKKHKSIENYTLPETSKGKKANNGRLNNKLIIEILPCPFCGGEPKVALIPLDYIRDHKGASISCADCGAVLFSDLEGDPNFKKHYAHEYLMDAVERWNKRV